MNKKQRKGGNKPRSKRSDLHDPLPTKAEILTYVQENPDRATKRDIARAFNVTGADRIPLKRMLRELTDEGMIEKPKGQRFRDPTQLPPVTVIQIVDIDTDGELIARPTNWRDSAPPPPILLAPGAGHGRDKAGSALGIGDRVLARLSKDENGVYEARVMRRLEQDSGRILGIYQKVGRDGRIMPIERGSRKEFTVRAEHAMDARSGELVFADLEDRRGRSHGVRQARITERLGNMDDPRTVSLIAIHNHGIPFEFPESVSAEAEAATQPALDKRDDLRDLPFITIDPADARDHDDAVFAEPDKDPNNEGGHIIWVAIADVSQFVRPGSELDREALRRGNSCYFPDRVVPMIPDRLSGGLCSLHENEDRAVLAVRLVIDENGKGKRHKFVRAMIRSRGSLNYHQIQSAHDGEPDEQTAPMMDEIVTPLWAAYRTMEKERQRRNPLDLELPEHKVEIGDDGHISRITIRERLDAHRLIEDFMIAANVAAAETLEKHRTALLYRVHERPSVEKLSSLQEFLGSLNIPINKDHSLDTPYLNKILHQVRDKEFESVVNEVMLRSQSQAMYSPDNLGHFGLNLERYAHFTSPIRRYADLIVHRALIRACKLGDGGLTDEEISALHDIGEEISNHERRAMAAERESDDRYMAVFLQEQIGAEFQGRIAGVTRFGLFVRLNETGADGLVPMRRVGRTERFYHSEKHHALIGEGTGARFRLGDPVRVRLEEATPVTGGLIFELLSEPKPGKKEPRNDRSDYRGKSSKGGKSGKGYHRKRRK